MNKESKVAFLKSKSIRILPYLLMLGLMCAVVANKVNLDNDEPFNYGAANAYEAYSDGYADMQIEAGVTYVPAEQPYVDYLFADEEHRFNYPNVWKNLATDNHPPLHYALMHTICSLFPGTFSMWYGGIINIIFMLLTMCCSNKLVKKLIDGRSAYVFSLLFCCNAALLSSVSMFRMYVMAMFCCVSVMYFLVTGVGDVIDYKWYIGLLSVTVLGALTHYHCIIYTVLSCIIYGIIQLLHKNWKKFLAFCFTELMAGGIAVLIYPVMLKHLFTGGRGTEAINNLAGSSMKEYGNRVQIFFDFVDAELAGNMLVVLLVVCTVSVLLYFVQRSKNQAVKEGEDNNSKNNIEKWLLLYVPMVIFFFFIAKTVPYMERRYLFPIYPLILTGVFCAVYNVLKCFIKRDRLFWMSFVCVLLFVTIVGWKEEKWVNLFKDSQSLLDWAEEHSDLDCILVYDSPYRTQTAYLEVKNYKSSTFIHRNHLDMINELDFLECDELLVLLRNEEKDVSGVLNTFINAFPKLDKWEKVGGHTYTVTYRLYGEPKEMEECALLNYTKTMQLVAEHNGSDYNVRMKEAADGKNVRKVSLSDDYSELWFDHKVLDVERGNYQSGTKVLLWQQNCGDNQKWKIEEQVDGSVIIASFNTNYVLAATSEGNIVIQELDGSDSQKWWIE